MSPEDFAQHDRNGLTPFSNIAQLKSDAKVTYWPFVHSPIRAVRQLDKTIVEVSAENLENDLTIPTDEILIVDLNDARDEEDRLDMLKRHGKDGRGFQRCGMCKRFWLQMRLLQGSTRKS